MDLIIGAGVTGLSYALFNKDNNYIIVEADKEIGGYCKTTKRNGFVWDYSGHFFHFQDQEIEKLITQNLNKKDLVKVIKNTKIKYKDNLIDYPFQKNIHQLPKDELIECLYDLFSIENKEYNSFKEMLYQKFGKAIAEKFLIPYNSKLYACNLDNLDKEAMGRFFPYAQKEEIIKNFKNQNNASYNSSFVYPINGAIDYINSIVFNIKKDKIKTNCKVIHINKEKQIVELSNGEKIKYDRLISTIPFPLLLSLTNIDYNKNIYSWNKVLVFNLGFKEKGKDQESHWLYFPENKYCFYRVGFYDNILNQNKMSLYVELGFNNTAIINPHEWLGTVLHDLEKANIIDNKQTLEDFEYIIMDPAYVHINTQSTIDVKQKKELLKGYNIYSIGRYGSWTYCSIEDNIKEALTLSKELK